MANAIDVGTVCNREVIVTSADESVLEAARLMREFHVGDLIVVDQTDAGPRPVGILTDRDLVVSVLAGIPEKIDKLTVGDVVTDDLVTVPEHYDVLSVIALMRDKSIRRIPVVTDANTLVGILTFDDVVELVADQLAHLAGGIAQQSRAEGDRRP